MPGSTSSALVPILRQLRLVRRRWNAREFVRAALMLAAASGLAAALLVLAALGTAPRRFVAAAVLLGVAWLASALGIGLGTRRRWLGRRTAHRQVDRHARLAGRLATIVDLGSRESALRPLLAAESAAILPLWEPHRLVPRRAPAGALAAVIASALALALAVVIAPLLLPAPGPTLVVRAAEPPRLPMRPGRSGPLARGSAVAETPSRGARDEPEDSLLAGMAEALQYRLHRELWGEEEAIRAQELARAEPEESPRDRARANASDGRDDEGGGESTGRVEPGDESREPETAGTEVADGRGTPEAGGTEEGAETRRGGGTADGAARGAGTATSPDLYGAPTGGLHRAAAPFTLGLTANVHMTGGAARPPTGDTPVQMPDANPALAERPRDAVGRPRAPVPPEYAAVVRRLFEREP